MTFRHEKQQSQQIVFQQNFDIAFGSVGFGKDSGFCYGGC